MPESPGAWGTRGRILARISDERLGQCRAVLQDALTDDNAKLAMEQILRATGMDPSDPLRLSILHSVRGLFPTTEQQQARHLLKLVDEASELNAEARSAFAQAFRTGEPNLIAATHYLRLLHRAGRLQDAIDFGMAVVPYPKINRSTAFMEQLAKVLLEAERPGAACAMIQQYYDRSTQPTTDFYALWARALYESQRWRELRFISDQLLAAAGRTNPQHFSIGKFYRGWSEFQLQRYELARTQLQRYVKDAVEPHPGALAQAWRAIAACARSQNQLQDEQTALLEAVRIAPEGDGADWLRLFEVVRELSPDAYERCEEYLTQAMRLLPKRVAELLPEWLKYGELGLRASGAQLRLELDALREAGRSSPGAGAGPFEVYEVARIHHEEGEHLATISGCKLLLTRYPGFLPALDLHAEACYALGEYATAAGLWFERLGAAGRDARTIGRLRSLPPGVLAGEQLLEMMRLDPHDTGRLHVARTLRAEGREQAALAGLTALELDPLGDEGFLLAAELMLGARRYREAFEVLHRIDPHGLASGRILPLVLTAALELGDSARIEEVLASVPSARIEDPRETLRVADRMLIEGRLAEVRVLLESFDARPELRSGDVLLRLATTGLLQADEALTLDSLERAEAFTAPGVTAFGRLILAVQRKQWSRLPLFVRAVVQSRYKFSRHQDVVLAILDERIDQAEREIAEARVVQPEDPLWPLLGLVVDTLRGRPCVTPESFGVENDGETLCTVQGGLGARDVRPLLAHLLALESPEWRVWTVADLSRLEPPTPGCLWASFLAARGLLELDHADDAERRVRQINRLWPRFVPAWALHEEIKLARLGAFDTIGLVRLREDRRQALGPRSGEEAEALLTSAWNLEAAGSAQQAMIRVRRALELDPQLEPAWVKLGALLADSGDTLGALDALQRAVGTTAVASNNPVVAQYVEALLAARKSHPSEVSIARVYNELNALMTRFQDDPLLALELARAELDNPGVSQAASVAKAYERLSRFREWTAKKPLEHLRLGATAAWKDFYQAHEPRRARAFLEQELLLRPGAIELWRMLGEVLEAEGRAKEAVELYETIQSMVPTGEVRRAVAALLAASGADPALVEQYIQDAMKLELRAVPDADLQVIHARALLNGSASQVDEGIRILREVLDEREVGERYSLIDIAQLYGTALVHRATAQDRALANRILLEIAEQIADQPRKQLVVALANVAAGVAPRR
jgi:tetratricopeptide (TPR) repeat protein